MVVGSVCVLHHRDRLIECLGDPLIVFSFGRSGTHMLVDLIRRNIPAFRALKWPLEPNHHVYGHLDDLIEDSPASARLAARLRRAPRPLLMTHRWPEVRAQADGALGRWLDRARLIHIVRHPKHAMTSSWPIECARAAAAGARLPDPEVYVRERARRWVHNLEALAATPHLQLRFEDVRRDPASTLREAAALTGEEPRRRSPVLLPPHESITDCRMSRVCRIDPPSTAVVARTAWKRAYPLVWTTTMTTALADAAGAAMAGLGYSAAAPRSSRLVAPAYPTATGQLITANRAVI